MQNFMLIFLCFLLIIIWPVNRYAMKKGAKMENLGMISSFFAFVSSSLITFFTHQQFLSVPGSVFGIFNGVMFGVGFCMIICYCLKIGPSGPTTAINNLGVVFPVALSIILSIRTHPIQLLSAIGAFLTLCALLLMAFTRSGDSGKTGSRWKIFVFMGWLFTGGSLSLQYLATAFDPDHSMAFTISSYFTSFIILLVISGIRKTIKINKVFSLCGMATGFANVLNIVALFFVSQYIPGYIVFPLTQIVPIVFMMLVGKFIYKESISKAGWTAMVLSSVGIVLMYAR